MRREFTKSVKVEIVKRAQITGVLVCEKCRQMIPKHFDIDHRDPDAMQIDKSRKLTAADGWLLCIPCHSEKTKADVHDISKAKRVEAKHLGAVKPKGFAKVSKTKPPLRVSAGVSEIARRYGITE